MGTEHAPHPPDASRAAIAWLDRRRPHGVVAALAAGLAAAPALPWWGPIAVALPTVGVALALWRPDPGLAVRVPAVLVLAPLALAVGAAVGHARVAAIDATAERALRIDRFEGEVAVLQRPRRTRFGSWALVELRSGPAHGSRVVARAGDGMRWPAGGEPGVLVLASGSLARPRRTHGSRLDWPAYLRRRGVAAELELDALRAVPARARTAGGAPPPHRRGFAGWVDSVRRRAERGIVAGMPAERGAVARGMVLGQDEAIDPLVVDDFRRSGLGHLLAVSGQNVVLLCALALPLLAVAGAGVRGRVLWLGALIVLYLLLAGAGPSLQRAAAMAIAGLAALAVGRVRSRWYALLVAAVVTLVLEPRVAAEPGWQLSFAAVAGILMLAPALRRPLGWLPGPFAEGAAMTLAATLATAPIAGHHFGAVSVAGLAANLVALPLVAPIVWLGMVQAVLGVAGGAATAADAPALGLATGLGRVNGALTGALVRVAEEFAALPGAQVGLPLSSPVAVIAAYLVPAVGWLAIGRRWALYWSICDRKRAHLAPAALRGRGRAALRGRGRAALRGRGRAALRGRGRGAARVRGAADARAREVAAAWRRAGLRRRIAVLAALGTALALAWHHAAGPAAPPEDLTVSFLDVGQGDATLIQDGAGAAVLFDAGPPEARTYRLLRRAGVRRLALVVATHASRDHHGGLEEVLERVPTAAILDGGDGTRDPAFAAAIAAARRRGVRRIAPYAGQALRAGRLRIRVLGPPPRPPGPPPEDPNPRALAALVSAGSFDLFLSGDAESDALLAYDLPPVEAMKVSHHGSADPGLPDLLDRLRPQVAAIEVGEGNPYGHPAPSTLAALHAQVPHVRRTDRDGTVRLTVRGGRMTLR
ncbi:MAG TPA: ComEC/Rec2 family competence protein [Thermoleophilaceae bacterium]|jgi:competence protein ComEC